MSYTNVVDREKDKQILTNMIDSNFGIIRFLPSYVGGKSRWITRLERLQGAVIFEPFAGSAVISANFASCAYLNDNDPIIAKILSRFDELIVPEVFTQDDYFKYRCQDDWWKYSYCLSKMAFSGVFRYTKNGFNVPVKKHLKSVSLSTDYEKALHRWCELRPVVTELDFFDIPIEMARGRTVVLDPPYQGSSACYNHRKFSFVEYWKRVHEFASVSEMMVVFDTVENLTTQGLSVVDHRVMRVNGAYPPGAEGVAVWGRDEDGTQLCKRLENRL